mgnify:CR=1 FL=1
MNDHYPPKLNTADFHEAWSSWIRDCHVEQSPTRLANCLKKIAQLPYKQAIQFVKGLRLRGVSRLNLRDIPSPTDARDVPNKYVPPYERTPPAEVVGPDDPIWERAREMGLLSR